jgi:hypothetical protein
VQVDPVALKQQVHAGALDVIRGVPEMKVDIWRAAAQQRGMGRQADGSAGSTTGGHSCRSVGQVPIEQEGARWLQAVDPQVANQHRADGDCCKLLIS